MYTGPKDAIQEKYLSKLVDVRSLDKPSSSRLSSGAVLADLKNVQVQYADRKVRWHFIPDDDTIFIATRFSIT